MPTVRKFAGFLILVGAVAFQVGAAGRTSEGSDRGAKLFDDSKALLHLSADFGVGINTNPYSMPAKMDEILAAAKAAGKGAPVKNNMGIDMLMKLTPNLFIKSQGRRFQFEVGYRGGLDILPDVTGKGERANFAVFDTKAHGRIGYKANRAFSIFVKNEFGLNRNTSELYFANVFKITDNLSTGVAYAPVGGALGFTADVSYGLEYFPGQSDFSLKTISNSDALKALNTQSFFGNLGMSWRFMPQTSLGVSAKMGTYGQDSQKDTVASTPFWINADVSGRISKKISGKVGVGYTNPLVSNKAADAKDWKRVDSNYIGVTANASVGWAVGEGQGLTLGYVRNMTPAPFFNFVGSDVVSLGFTSKIARKWDLSLSASAMFLGFGLPIGDNSKKARRDIALNIPYSLMYRVRPWFSLGIQGQSVVRWTNADVMNIYEIGASGYASDADKTELLFHQHEAVFVLKVTY